MQLKCFWFSQHKQGISGHYLAQNSTFYVNEKLGLYKFWVIEDYISPYLHVHVINTFRHVIMGPFDFVIFALDMATLFYGPIKESTTLGTCSSLETSQSIQILSHLCLDSFLNSLIRPWLGSGCSMNYKWSKVCQNLVARWIFWSPEKGGSLFFGAFLWLLHSLGTQNSFIPLVILLVLNMGITLLVILYLNILLHCYVFCIHIFLS